MKLIAGLGNPGTEYARTRHNTGFMVLEALARRHGLSRARQRFHAGTIEAVIRGQKVMLMQPTTYMNRSGLAVGAAARFYRLPPEQVMVVVDDTALPLGALRMRPGGSDGGHKGLADVRQALGTDRFPRLRVGIGRPGLDDQPISRTDYVLGRFTDEQQAVIDRACQRACDALETWLVEGIDLAMSRYNSPTGPGSDPDHTPERSVPRGPQPPNEGDDLS